MTRLRYNGLSTTLGASLTSSATTVTFAAALTHSGGTAVPTIGGGDYIPLSILDSTGKLSEIVYLTAYTSGATTGTITRGQEGTTGVSHASGDKVVHGPSALDHIVPRCRITTAAAQSLPNDTDVVMTFPTEAYDTHTLHDTVTNNSRITFDRDGAWLYGGLVAFTNTAAGGRRIAVVQRSGVEINRVSLAPVANTFTYVPIDGVIDAIAGDYITLIGTQDSGGTLNTVPAFCFFSATYLGT